MGILERKQRQRDGVRDSILQAAWALVQDEGWSSLSIRKIADAIEYSIPVIYSHFENKDAILQEFTKQGFRKLNSDLLEVQAQEKNSEKQLMAIAQAYWQFAFQNKEYYQLMYGLGMPTCEKIRQVSELEKFTQILKDSVQNIITNSNNAEADPFLKFLTFWSMLHGLVSINMVDRNTCPDNLHHSVLTDAVTGFIKNIKN